MTDELTTTPRTHAANPQEVDRALTALAINGCNYNRTARELQEAGEPWDESTLRLWRKTTYPDRYESLRSEVVPRIQEQLNEEHYDLAAKQTRVSRAATTRLSDQVEEMSTRDLLKTVSTMDVGSGIHTQRGSELVAGPSAHVHVHASMEELERAMNAKGIGIEFTTESTATEITDADPVTE